MVIIYVIIWVLWVSYLYWVEILWIPYFYQPAVDFVTSYLPQCYSNLDSLPHCFLIADFDKWLELEAIYKDWFVVVSRAWIAALVVGETSCSSPREYLVFLLYRLVSFVHQSVLSPWWFHINSHCLISQNLTNYLRGDCYKVNFIKILLGCSNYLEGC